MKMKGNFQKKENNNQKTRLKEKGITLIALVVTIIILLILAGVAIASVTGDNGLFRKAREATNTYKDAERDESTALGVAESEIDKILSGGYAKGNTKVTVSDGLYYIPDGFKLAEDSGRTVNEGIVVEDKNGNQWVWIPCYVEGGVGESDAETTGLNKYDRYAFLEWNFESNYSEELDSNDQASISKFGGYYIGRYEAGDKESTIAKEMRTEEKYLNNNEGDASHTVTIKKGQAPYNYITYNQCVSLSNGIAIANKYDTSKMYTKLCSSYAWDTALKFIGGDYATDSHQGNYASESFDYIDINGEVKTKEYGSYNEQFGFSSGGPLIPTGQTASAKNIYDMGGNAREISSETGCDNDYVVYRGGNYDGHVNDAIAPCNRFGSILIVADKHGFRPTLYLKEN